MTLPFLENIKAKYSSINQLPFFRQNNITTDDIEERVAYAKYNRSNYSDFKIVTQDGETFLLNVVTDLTRGMNESVVVFESATGDGGETQVTGRTQETIPIRGYLLADYSTQLKQRIEKLVKIKENGEAIDFISPFRMSVKSNKFIIQNIEFNFTRSTLTSIPLSMTLTEDRKANVRKISANLVNYQSAEAMKEYYYSLIGNI